jgi:hypothetical protein
MKYQTLSTNTIEMSAFKASCKLHYLPSNTFIDKLICEADKEISRLWGSVKYKVNIGFINDLN